MKNLFKLKLTARMIVSILGSVLLMLGILLTVLGLKLYSTSKLEGISKVSSQSKVIAAMVENYIDKAFESMTNLRSVSYAMMNNKNKANNREMFNNMLQEVVNKNKSFLAIWSMYEPNEFDGMDKSFLKNAFYREFNGGYNVTYYKNNNQLSMELANLEQYNADFYTIPKKRQINTMLEPYYYSYVGDTSHQVFETSVIVPILKKNKFIGVVAVDIELESLNKIILPAKIFESGTASIISNKAIIAAHHDKTLIGQTLTTLTKNDTSNIINAIQKGEEYYNIENNSSGEKTLRCFTPVRISGTNAPWAVMVEVPMSEVTAQADSIIKMLVIIGLISLLVFAAILIYISRSITKPIIKAANFVEQIAKGDLTQKIRSSKTDEIGFMINNLQHMSEKIRTVVSDIVMGSANISNAGGELNLASQQLSEGANEQAASTEEVSSSMEEMVSNINQNADNAQQTERIAIQASNDIEVGSKAVLSTLEAMKKIAEKITIIGEIAEKTDLLAINAAIEAARAGEHGKGFAVVAIEVRKLAERSQAAAREINELSRTSVKIADESGSVLQKIIPDIKRTALLVQEISAASMEQNSGASQINNAILQLNMVTQRTATSAEEISANAEQLVQQADSLMSVVSFFNTGNQENMTLKKRVPVKTQKNVYNGIGSIENKGKTQTEIILPPLDDSENDFEHYL